MSVQPCTFRAQPALSLALPTGDRVVVALHGAQVISWCTADGVERLYLSPDALFDGASAIRGGIPICCPQFNTRGTLPKHGFMRTLPWEPMAQAAVAASEEAKEEAGEEEAEETAVADELQLRLRADARTRAVWPQEFEARLRVALSPKRLRVELSLANTGSAPWSFTAALHSYLRVDELADARLHGLVGQRRWDAVRDVHHAEPSSALVFDAEFDSVYAAALAPLRLTQPAGTLEIAQSVSCTETVVWNPGAELCARLPDMPDDGYRHMLCVEAAAIDAPVLLAPGTAWLGWQQLTVV